MTEHGSQAGSAARMRKIAQQLLASGDVGDESLRLSGAVGVALAVVAPDGTHRSWFVPVTVDDRLAAFMQLGIDGQLMRFSSFQRAGQRAENYSDCPPAADWLDRKRIQARAAAKRRADETVGEPFLSYDHSPERLAWAVPMESRRGRRVILVAGDAVYEQSAGKGIG